MDAPTTIRPAGTAYLVLRKYEDNWREVKRVTATSPQNAIKRAIGDQDPGDTAWVAVPARSWSPTKVTQKVEKSLVLEDGAA